MASFTGKDTNGDDRISKLSDSILSHILTMLPIKDAVSTSILSTRWRYLFVLMLNLNIHLDILRASSPPQTVKSFTNFMDKLLFVHTERRIEQFRLNYYSISGIDVSRVSGWISAALWRGVKEIDLICIPRFKFIPILPTALLFTSKLLVRLKLGLGIPFVMTVPVHVCLPRLETLEITFVIFEDDESFNRLISSCPALEDLSFSTCDMRNIKCLKISNSSLQSLTLIFQWIPLTFDIVIVIDVPSLVYFKYEGFIAKSYSMGNMPSLVSVSADICFPCCDLRMSSESVDIVKFFDGIGNVKSLHLTIDLEALPFLSHKRFVALQNLHYLVISDWCGDLKGPELLEFLEFSHNLQTLEISYLSSKVSFPMEKVPVCVAYQLKEFKVVLLLEFDRSSLFELVTYVLKNATVLEKLTVSCYFFVAKEKLHITRHLLSLPRSSSKCEIIISD